jgi:hypothetical protein
MAERNVLPVGFFDAEMERRFPWIAWRTPIHIVVTNGIEGWGCRLCIAYHGFKAQDAERLLFHTLQDFERHQETAHAVNRQPEEPKA